jgi:cytochrome c biogenesis protein CcmG, thiol:disulfide interchange protein DsbE
LVVVSINIPEDRDALARKFVEMYRLPFLVGRDSSGWITHLYGVEGTPTTFFIGKHGKIVDRIEGTPEDEKEIESELERRINWMLAG